MLNSIEMLIANSPNTTRNSLKMVLKQSGFTASQLTSSGKDVDKLIGDKKDTRFGSTKVKAAEDFAKNLLWSELILQLKMVFDWLRICEVKKSWSFSREGCRAS
jgi:hypothetical protein